jgi:hypothetical protein
MNKNRLPPGQGEAFVGLAELIYSMNGDQLQKDRAGGQLGCLCTRYLLYMYTHRVHRVMALSAF